MGGSAENPETMEAHRSYEPPKPRSDGSPAQTPPPDPPEPTASPEEPAPNGSFAHFIGSMDESPKTSSRWALSGLGLTLFLLAVVAAVNAVALWGIFAARRGALEAARHELELETAAHARSLEAVLATLRGDLVFLSQSPVLVRYQESAASSDPLVRRWSRLDVEGALLLFLEAHPAVLRLELHGREGKLLVLAGRRRSAPAILPLDAESADLGIEAGTETARTDRGGAALWRGRFPLGAPRPGLPTVGAGTDGAGRGAIEVRIDPARLLAIAAPGYGDRLRLMTEAADATPVDAEPANDPGGNTAGTGLVARAGLSEAQWSPPLRGTLVRQETESRLVASVESLAGRYRTTVILYSLVLTLTLVLGTVALRQSRKAVQLQAARRHEADVRELERQLFHSERLASLGRLAAGLAHEINNPLEGMANYLSLLEEDLETGRTVGTGELVRRLRQGLDRVAGAMRQVLALADPAHAPKEPLDLVGVLTEAVEFLRANPAYRKVCMELEVSRRPLEVRGTPVTLGQLFLNLLLNACQVQPDGGEVQVWAGQQDGRVRVCIADRGPGLPAELGGRIFEPFVSTRTSSGLGLAVCLGIVEDHRGTIRGLNREDGGAVFEVVLPAAETAEPEASTESEASEDTEVAE